MGGNYPESEVPVEFYMIDVGHRQVRIYKGMTDTVRTVADNAVADFVKDRRKVALVTPTPTILAKTAPAIQKGTVSTPYKIAIFPFGGPEYCLGRSRPLNREVASEVHGLIKQNESLTVKYSYYDGAVNQPSIKKPDKLWSGSKPNVNLAYRLGQERGVDAIVMHWRPSEVWPFGGMCTDRLPPYPIKVYLIDVKQQKTYSLKGREKDLRAMTSQVFTDFMQGRQK